LAACLLAYLEMSKDFEPDEELARLETMHHRVEKLRSQLQDLKLSAGLPAEKQPSLSPEPPSANDDVSSGE